MFGVSIICSSWPGLLVNYELYTTRVIFTLAEETETDMKEADNQFVTC